MSRTYTFREFKQLHIQDQVNYINMLLDQGETLTGIGSNRHINKAYIRDTFKAKDYIYSKDYNAYINKEAPAPAPAKDPAADPAVNHIKCFKEMDLGDIEDRLQFLEEQVEIFRGLLEKPAAGRSLNNIVFTGNIKTRSFKIYENVLNDFIKFCNDHKNYRQQDLMTQALHEFINKEL